MTALKLFIKRLLIGIAKLLNSNSGSSYLPAGRISFDRLKLDHEVLYKDTVEGYTRKPPVTIGGLHKAFKRNLHEPPRQTFVMQGIGWYVWGNQGAVITDDHYLFEDVSREFDNRTHSIFNQFKLTPPSQVDEYCAVLATSGSFVYYHWMFDILPRIAILKKAVNLSAIDKFIINYLPNNYQNETLARAGIDDSKVIASNDHWGFHVRAKKLLVPSLASANNRPSLRACVYLRELYAKEMNNGGAPLTLYIQRPHGRKIVNEDEVLAFLTPFKVEIIHPEKLSVAQQAALFARANMVIGAHGAGLTNIVFCKPGTTIIDLFSAEWVNPCYWIIAEHLDLRYGYLEGERIKRGGKGKRADIRVNVTRLKNLFAKLEIAHAG
ncbi:glycosyltransferase family 61 protein [Mucilaginibacter sp. 14171R-50]|uniref:glycosyltransferase family 61 protein n=1 Tax=Mucilaginibacter sp. 14171R-50 TaxID=2703789 RepID=UPI00138D8EF6|nr:glycosyltransferase family 61 protein [Mucilaginibacter sp. 14171R-50]QHS56339.1 glycosyltransferase family 61 protein [Mucilaginibacter sp. 14171R-50]